MLRLTLEIVPFGMEEAKYEIGKLEIANTGQGNRFVGSYAAVLEKDEQLKSISIDCFDRSRGAWELVKEVLLAMDLQWEK